MSAYILFHNSSEAIRASRVLKKNNVVHHLVSVPRHLSSDCGYCVSLEETHLDAALALFTQQSVPYDKIEKE